MRKTESRGRRKVGFSIFARNRVFTIFCLAVVLTGVMVASGIGWNASLSARASQIQQIDPPGKSVEGQISDSVLRQIQALLDEKESRSPAQRKIDSQLLYSIKINSGQSIAAGVPTLDVSIVKVSEGKTVVDMKAIVTADLLEKITAVGLEVISVYPKYNSIRARVPLERLESVAELPEVRFIQPKQEAIVNTTAPETTRLDATERADNVRDLLPVALERATQKTVRPSIGGVNSEGDVTHKAAVARSTFGVNGAGVRIGVISNGVEGLEQAVAAGDLPPDVTVLSGQAGSDAEGTAMLEIIHDLAPGAQLFFATGNGGIANFAQNIRDLRGAGCDIIVDDVAYLAETPLQDGEAPGVNSTTGGGLITEAVNDVTASGALYFSSAGNSGNKSDNQSGVWEGDFVDGGPNARLPGGTVHNFGGGTLFDTISTTGQLATLFWSDPLGGSNNDYDLFLLDSSGFTVWAASTNPQTGSQDPFEHVPAGFFTNDQLVVLKKAGAATRFLHLSTNRGRLAIGTDGQIAGHACAANAFACAATPAASASPGPPPGPVGPFPNPFNSSNTVELFSSDGPRRLFFNADGTAITPGNLTSSGGLLRQKPDITAADGVSVTGAGGFSSPFFGTSAAAPHAAAIAGLLKSSNPLLTAVQIRTALVTTAIDIEAPGADRDSGAGIIMELEAMQSIGAAPSANFEVATVVAMEVGGNGNGFIEPGEGGTLSVTLRNSGIANATNITATLSSITPGVTVNSAASSYPDISAPSGTAANNTLFVFALSSNSATPLAINFSLRVSYSGGPTPRIATFNVLTGLRNWSQQTSGTLNPLWSVHFTDDSFGWAAGENATLLRTTNGGSTWSPLSTGVSAANGFFSVRFLSQNLGWVGGLHSVARTTDGGSSWNARQFPPSPFPLPFSSAHFRFSFFPVSADFSWSVGTSIFYNGNFPPSGDRYLAHSRYDFSGGPTTESSWFQFIFSNDALEDVWFIDPDNGWSVGSSGRITRITGGTGATPVFTAQASGTAETLLGIFMLDPNNGWTVGTNGRILHTTNGGSAWTPQASGVSATIWDVHFKDINNGWVVGDFGLILKTTDGGSTWTPEISGVISNLRGVFFTNTGTGYAVGDSGVILKMTSGPCTSPPAFGGLDSATNAQLATCQLDLAWSPATPSCVGPITYNVFRATTPNFTPSSGNMIASGVTATSYLDNSPLVGGTTYHYIVRAVDASNNTQDTNTIERSAVPSGPPASFTTITETFEGALSGGGFDNAGWSHNAITGAVDWTWSTALSKSPTHSWFSASQGSVSDRVLTSPSFGVNTSTTLSFWHTFSFEGIANSFFDGGTLEISTNGGSSWEVMPDSDFALGGFNATISGNFGNPIGGKRAWGQGTIGAMTQVIVNLASFAGTNAQLRWHEGDDVDTVATGWFVDSVEIANATGTLGSCMSAPPTSVSLVSFTGNVYDGGTLIGWKTGSEVDNLGFNLYRDQDGKRARINAQIIAGSALVAGSGVRLGAGRSYTWWDATTQEKVGSKYWLEAIDLKGISDWYGPITPIHITGTPPELSQAGYLSMIGDAAAEYGATRPVAPSGRVAEGFMNVQTSLAGKPAVKLFVKREAWYSVTGRDLFGAGLDPSVDPRFLQLFVEGREQPISIKSQNQSQLSPNDLVEFYGIGLDTASSDERVYWLIAGAQPGLRIGQSRGNGFGNGSTSFPCTVERKDRTIYFSALKNGEKENFFGSVIARDPVSLSMVLPHIDMAAREGATIEVALQGVTSLNHKVGVELNGTRLGEAVFVGQAQGLLVRRTSASLLKEGPNLVRLISQGGESDVSLIDYVRLTYPHTFSADADTLAFTSLGNKRVEIDGFSSTDIRVIDVTDPSAVLEAVGTVRQDKAGYSISISISGAGERRLLAFTASQASRPAAIAANQPSGLRQPANRADLLIITRQEFFGALDPLKTLRESQGLTVNLVDITDIYDEFSSGEKSPQAIKDFLGFTQTSWRLAPRFILFAGDASFDPRNYLGAGDFDLIPSKLIDTTYLETASDDWFADFNDDGLAEMYVGRLPVRTSTEAEALVSKIVNYDLVSTKLPFARQAVLLIADRNDGFDFESASHRLRELIPSGFGAQEILRGRVDDAAAKKQVIAAINAGQTVVNYTGHGSANGWHDLLTTNDIPYLNNQQHLSLFVAMTCLNGFFQEPTNESLAERLLKSRGGAIVVWASSGLTEPVQQALMNQQAYRLLFASGSELTIGEVTAKAKASVSSIDIRRTWILFGDPTTRIRYVQRVR